MRYELEGCLGLDGQTMMKEKVCILKMAMLIRLVLSWSIYRRQERLTIEGDHLRDR